jgi:hypothetical protein
MTTKINNGIEIKSNTQWIEQFHSSDNPFTPVNNIHYIDKQLQSTYHKFNHRNHFLCNEFTDLINLIKNQCRLTEIK